MNIFMCSLCVDLSFYFSWINILEYTCYVVDRCLFNFMKTAKNFPQSGCTILHMHLH